FDMGGHRFLIHESYVHQIDNWSSRATELKRMLSYAVTTNSGTVLKELCANGGGLTLMPSYVAAIDERLVPLDLPELVQIEFWLAYTQRVQHLSRGRKFIDWIRMQFRHEDNPWFQETFLHPKNWDDKTRRRLSPVRLAVSNSRR
ncbi:MAG: LysR substrate-binding domain-containing protein, partial [Henriciella sp.]